MSYYQLRWNICFDVTSMHLMLLSDDDRVPQRALAFSVQNVPLSASAAAPLHGAQLRRRAVALPAGSMLTRIAPYAPV